MECNSAATIINLFEYGAIQCDGADPACFLWFPSDAFTHNQDGTHLHIDKAYIVYDAAGFPSDSYRRYASAHEFGHAMGLGHHDDTDGKCAGVDWVMETYVPPDYPYSDPICAQVPTSAELCGSASVYAFIAHPCYEDADADGCARWEEDGPQRGAGGERNWTYFWDLFDVTGDKEVDLLDALSVLQFFGDPGLPATPGDLRDRAFDGTGWRSTESNDGVDTIDVLVLLQQFAHICENPP